MLQTSYKLYDNNLYIQVTELSTMIEQLAAGQEKLNETLKDVVHRQNTVTLSGQLDNGIAESPPAVPKVDVHTENPPFRPLFPVGKC